MAKPEGTHVYPDELMQDVKKLAEKHGSLAALARHWKITKQYLDLMRAGKNKWQPRFLQEIGWERVTIYRKITPT